MSALSRRSFGLGMMALGGAMASSRVLAASAPQNWMAGFTTPPELLASVLKRQFGRIPKGLAGTLYRAGPAQFERAGERLGHWFDGDGMVQAFAIGPNGVGHRGKFVATDKRRAEQEAGRFLYPGYGFAPQSAVPFSHPDQMNAANTNILAVGDEIWALWEGGSPWCVDPASLDTIGRQRFPGDLDGLVFSAHPKRQANGEIWNFGGLGARCVIWSLDGNGAVHSARPLELPRSTLMHDFAVTERHIVLLAPPLVEIQRPAGSLIDRFTWQGSEPLIAYVLRKSDLTVARTHELPPRFLYHVGNAWEDGQGNVRVDACLAKDAAFAMGAGRDLPQGRYTEPPYAEPTMITLFSDGRSQLEGVGPAGEFPRVNGAHVAKRHRYSWTVLPHGIARWDWETGRHQAFEYGSAFWPEEPIFVAKPDSRKEDDGWIVATRLDMERGRTELLIFDAREISDGPLAIFACVYPVPLGFHGDFVARH